MTSDPRHSPDLSVIIPTYNRAATLRECIRALRDSDCGPERFEIIVSDDGSDDDTSQVAASFADGRGPDVRYLHQVNAGANRARNQAIRAARGELLLFINDDIIATPQMVPRHLAGHARYPDEASAVLGRVTLARHLPRTHLSQLHLDRAFERLEREEVHDWRVFFTCNVSVKRRLLERAGMFEERIRYHEDLELGERLSHHGLRVVYEAEALGYHDHELKENELLRIAQREAHALVIWAQLAPHLRSTLGSMGYEPGMSVAQRIRVRLTAMVASQATVPFWLALAGRCPSCLGRVSLAIYGRVYESVRLAHIQHALRQERGTARTRQVSHRTTPSPP